MMRGYLKVLTLKALKKEDKSGYGLIKVIHEETGNKPSYGSIYPLLEQLHKNKLVRYKEKDKKKIYSLTNAGENKLKELLDIHGEVWEKAEDMMKLFMTISNTLEMKQSLAMMRTMKDKNISFEGFPPEVIVLETTIGNMMIDGSINKKSKEIKEIIKTAIQELKKLK